MSKETGAASVGVLRDNLLGRRANARNVSFRISLRWPIHVINPIDKTKLSHKETRMVKDED